ncbi:methylated-DNA--[protein]-cysteine S-methyltransferase [Pelagibius sp. 7325]|uniref:bifunctional transcriptional activator/DNA repair enzyme AdaA n=1 Tax=Pelagibius sp. 7325 TaxID=3131994 RepID=UPI0030ECDA43
MDMQRAKCAADSQAQATPSQLALVRRACDLIDAQDCERMTLAEIAETLDVSPWHLQRLFKRVMGVSPRDYADARRNAAFRAQLKNGESIAQATYGAGYGSSSRIYERAERMLGMTPASYAKGGKGAVIAYDIVESPLGLLLVAATAKGLCFLSIGDNDSALVEELEHEFPQAESIARDQHSIAHSVSVVIDFLEGKIPHAELPLDVRATAFQRRVWNELIAIPCGETLSYSEIAERMGVPRGQRAVGRACATNPVSLVIPCHRALREDGQLGGYRWGVERKAALLEGEAEHPE